MFRAKYAGTCRVCGQTIRIGDEISWSKRRKGSVRHAQCSGIETEPAPGPIPVEAAEDRRPKPVLVEDELDELDNLERNDPQPEAAPMPVNGHAVPNQANGNDPFAVMAAAMVPYLERKLSAKVDAAQVQQQVNHALANHAETVREQVAEAIKQAQEAAVTRVVLSLPSGEEPKPLGMQHKQMPTLLKLMHLHVNVMLCGEAGSGKSKAVEEAAKALDKRFGMLSVSPETTESRVVGYMDANGNYRRTMFREFYENGGIFLFDEYDNGTTALLKTLNSAVANDWMAFPDNVNEPIKRHPDFLLIATSNTDGNGGSVRYNDANELCVSILDRFCRVKWDYDTKLERALALAVNPDAENWVNWVIQARDYLKERHPRMIATPRASIEGARLLRTGFTYQEVAAWKVFGAADKNTVATILRDVPLPA